MRFLMLVCRDNTPVDPPKQPEGDVEEWVTVTTERGQRITGDRLGPESQAVTVRVRDGQVLTTDGPFLETKEVLGGFDVLECQDLAEAIEVAAAHPFAQRGVFDLRPIAEVD